MTNQQKNGSAGDRFPAIETENSSVVRRAGRKKQGPPWMLIGVGAGCAIVILLGTLIFMFLGGEPKPIFDEGEKALFAEVNVPMVVELGYHPFKEPDYPVAKYTLDEGPDGAVVEQDGTLRWTPERGGEFSLQVSAVTVGDADRKETRRWTIMVDVRNRPPTIDSIARQLVQLGEVLEVQIHAVDPDNPKQKIEYRLLKGSPKGAKINAKTGVLSWTPKEVTPGSEVRVRVAAIEAVRGGLGAKQSFMVCVLPREKESVVVVEEKPVEKPIESTAPVEPSGPTAEELAAAEHEKLKAELLEIFDENRVFVSKEYPTFRRIYAKEFELNYADSIWSAYGKNRTEMTEWFEKYPAIKEEFYTAIDPETDKIDQTLKIFTELVKRFPKTFPAYSEAAIATAVTWDAGSHSFGYGGHQRRTKSEMPEGRIDGVANFEYLSHAEMVLGRRMRAMPWEFLIHVVNHPTPIIERRWAVSNYLDKQVGIGKCYKDVPYDHALRDRGGDFAELNGHFYSLPEIRQHGGVCAMQADYASRVAKSLGVPAAYTGGQSQSLNNHAWVMWVELLKVSKGGIQFKVESYGRYRGDKYYVGSLLDPKSCKRITDRQLELRLHNIGFGVQNKRHAELIMRTYPLYCEARDLDVDARLRFLGEVIRLSPGTESAWLEIARMSADHEITAKENRRMKVVVAQFFKTFANFPDFTWIVFDDLIAYRNNPKEAAALYEQLITMYVQAKRPDLGCKAVLRYADLVSAQGWDDRAVDALAMMILAFPGEGRYVPKMLDRLESFVDALPETPEAPEKKIQRKKTQEKLVAFYKALIPKVPKYRGKRLTDYCETMYGRAIQFFVRSDEPQAAAMVQAELTRLQAELEAKKRGL